METLKELLMPKTFSRLSYTAVILWMVCGAFLLGISLVIENAESKFACNGKNENMDKVTKDCFAEYEKKYYKIPLAGFLGLLIFLTLTFCIIYSQVVKGTIDELQRGIHDPNAVESNLMTRRGLFIAYCCQLAARFALRILLIALQFLLLYPASFPSKFNCTLTQSQGSRSSNASHGNIQNITNTLYDCVNGRAVRETFWNLTVCFMNGLFAVVILVEIFFILLGAKVERRITENLHFCLEYLKSYDRMRNRSRPNRMHMATV